MSNKVQKGGATAKWSSSKDASSRATGRKSLLIDYVEKRVSVITNDGRNIVGRMKGFDQVCNIILEKSIERVFSVERGVQVIALGLYVIRGDNIAIVGELDEEKDSHLAWNDITVRCRTALIVNLVLSSAPKSLFLDALNMNTDQT